MHSTHFGQINRHLRSRGAKLALLSLAMAAMHGNVVNDGIAAFSLNWQRDYAAEGATFNSNNAYAACNLSYIPDANCTTGGFGGDFNLAGSHKDGTAFLQEQLTLGGQLYFHLIVGDYTTDSMTQEVFIKSSSGNPTFGSFGGVRVSDSVANNSNQTFSVTQPYSSDSSNNGNGSANPNNVIMRQVINETFANGDVVHEEFLKDSFSQKPYINSTITTAEMVSTVIYDMRGKNYSTLAPITLSDTKTVDSLNPNGMAITNTVQLLGANRQGTEGDFDIHTDAQTSHISAGGFTYTTGSGYGGSGGTYTWSDPVDNFQPMNRNYQGYCNPAQNPVWGSGACVGGGAAGGGGWGW